MSQEPNDRSPEEAQGAKESVENVQDVDIPSLGKLQLKENSVERNKARAANLMGYLIVGGFVGTAAITVASGLWCGKLKSTEVFDYLKAIATTFGTPLGFVLGYYYGIVKK